MIKNVLFDFGGVFVNLTREIALKRFEKLGIHDADALIDPYRQSGLFLQLELGEIIADELTQKLCDNYNINITRDDVTYALMGFMQEVESYKFDYIANELPKGIKKILVSNTNEIVFGEAESNHFLPSGRTVSSHFDELYLSYKEHVCKPDKLIFERIIEGIGIEPGETLFIDDGPKNCEVAREMGFVTYCCDNGEDWTKVLRKMLG